MEAPPAPLEIPKNCQLPLVPSGKLFFYNKQQQEVVSYFRASIQDNVASDAYTLKVKVVNQLKFIDLTLFYVKYLA